MKMTLHYECGFSKVLLLLLGLSMSVEAEAQLRVPPHRFDCRELGYPFFNQIPADGSYITSLTLGPDGRIYGATSGFRPYFFVFSDETDQVKPLGYLPDGEGVHHSLVTDKKGSVYLGTGKNVIIPFAIRKPTGGGLNNVSEDLWRQVQDQYRNYAGGHLYRYDPAKEMKVGTAVKPANVEDLGIPVAGDGIYCLTIDPERDVIYGVSYPHAHFFLYDLNTRTTKDKGPLFRDVLFGGPDLRTVRTLPRNLAVDKAGFVYASTDGGRLVRYGPQKQDLEILDVRIPGEFMQVVEVWVASGDVLYGGTSEGFLFRFDPNTGRVDNLGKPMVRQRVRGLTLAKDGRVIGVGGDRDQVNLLFTYDPRAGSFQILGSVEVDRSPYYAWQAHQFDAMVTSRDGTIFLGESDRRGHLFLYVP